MAVCQALHRHILGQPDRKVVHRLTSSNKDVPEQVARALLYIPFAYGNTIITKRYKHNEQSGAFDVHRDPEEFASGPLVLCTLGGRALLSVIFDDRRLVEVDCVPNTVVVALNNPMHCVSDPLDEETRTFMFIGSDSTLVA